MENEFNQLQSKYEEIKQEKEILIQNLGQVQSKIAELEKEAKTLKNELKYEEIAHNTLLNEERNKRQVLEQKLTQKQVEITNYESQKQAGDRIIQQLKGELNELRVEKVQNIALKQELQIKDQKIQELTEQLEIMTKIMEQDLTGQVEFPPKGWN